MRLELKIRFAFVLATLAACGRVVPTVGSTSPPASSLTADIDTLTSRAFGGREAGTAGADSAAGFLVRRYQHLALRPLFRSTCDSTSRRCQPSYLEDFQFGPGFGHNVGTVVDGSGYSGRTEYVVIGAHFDGLGRSPTWALDRDAGFVMRPGADDNASGTAAVLELARRFRERRTRRSIMLLNFDAEEEGRVGSRALVLGPPAARAAMVFMLNLDMIGRLDADRLYIEGRPTDPSIRAIFDSAATAVRLRLQFIPGDNRSDDASFMEAGVAAAELSTGNHADYHTARDVPSRVNVDGLRRVVDFAELVARRLADR